MMSSEIREISTIIHNVWPVLLALLGAFAWIIRLEHKVKTMKSPEQDQEEKERFVKLEASVQAQEEALEEYKKDQNEKQLAIWSKFDTFQLTLMSILQSVARLEGRLEIQTKEKQ